MNKKLSLIWVVFFIKLFSNNLYSQVGNTIVDTNSVWSINNQIVYPMPPTSYYIHLKGDTIIDSKQYTKVWNNNDLSLTDDMELYGLIREENQKTYIRYNYNGLSGENLLYDFSLNIGDSVLLYQIDTIYFYWFTVTNVDSIEINNKMHKRIILSGNFYTDITWVEKIGCLDIGLFYSPMIFLCGVREDLLCYYYNNSCLYTNPNFNYCTVGLDNPLKTESKTIIYPNPVKDYLNIESKEIISKIEVLDIEGRLLIRKEDINNINYTTNLNSLSKGVYILKIKYKNQKIASYKLLK